VSLKERDRAYLAGPARRRAPGNVVDIAEWTDPQPEDFEPGSPRHNRELYWQKLLRIKLSRSRVDEVGAHDADLVALFRRLADEWRRETLASSSMTDIVLHPSYQRIIGLGRQVVPLILEELEREPYHWFWALSAITGEDPATEDATLEGATAKWLKWGEEHQLLHESQTA
jgi:hypothetical protein